MSFEILSYKALVSKLLSDVRQKRIDLELSQQQAAEWFDVSVGTIRRWEKGDTMPHSRHIASMQVFVNSSPNDIYRLLNF